MIDKAVAKLNAEMQREPPAWPAGPRCWPPAAPPGPARRRISPRPPGPAWRPPPPGPGRPGAGGISEDPRCGAHEYPGTERGGAGGPAGARRGSSARADCSASWAFSPSSRRLASSMSWDALSRAASAAACPAWACSAARGQHDAGPRGGEGPLAHRGQGPGAPWGMGGVAEAGGGLLPVPGPGADAAVPGPYCGVAPW